MAVMRSCVGYLPQHHSRTRRTVPDTFKDGGRMGNGVYVRGFRLSEETQRDELQQNTININTIVLKHISPPERGFPSVGYWPQDSKSSCAKI